MFYTTTVPQSPPSYEAIVLDPNGPRSQTNLFVRKLASAVTESDMQQLFSPYGNIVSFALMRDIYTGESLGTAFVRFDTHEEAKRAMAALDGTELYGRPISIQWAKKQHDGTPVGEARKKIHKLFVRNIPLDVTGRHLRQLFSPYGAISNVTIHGDTAALPPVEETPLNPCGNFNGLAVGTSHSGGSKAQPQRNIAFILYLDDGAAEKAVKALHNVCPFPGCRGIPLMVKLAEDNRQRLERRQRFGDVKAANTLSPTTSLLEMSPPTQGLTHGLFTTSPLSAVLQTSHGFTPYMYRGAAAPTPPGAPAGGFLVSYSSPMTGVVPNVTSSAASPGSYAMDGAGVHAAPGGQPSATPAPSMYVPTVPSPIYVGLDANHKPIYLQPQSVPPPPAMYIPRTNSISLTQHANNSPESVSLQLSTNNNMHTIPLTKGLGAVSYDLSPCTGCQAPWEDHVSSHFGCGTSSAQAPYTGNPDLTVTPSNTSDICSLGASPMEQRLSTTGASNPMNSSSNGGAVTMPSPQTTSVTTTSSTTRAAAAAPVGSPASSPHSHQQQMLGSGPTLFALDDTNVVWMTPTFMENLTTSNKAGDSHSHDTFLDLSIWSNPPLHGIPSPPLTDARD